MISQLYHYDSFDSEVLLPGSRVPIYSSSGFDTNVSTVVETGKSHSMTTFFSTETSVVTPPHFGGSVFRGPSTPGHRSTSRAPVDFPVSDT